jgi:hypothetical protein
VGEPDRSRVGHLPLTLGIDVDANLLVGVEQRERAELIADIGDALERRIRAFLDHRRTTIADDESPLVKVGNPARHLGTRIERAPGLTSIVASGVRAGDHISGFAFTFAFIFTFFTAASIVTFIDLATVSVFTFAFFASEFSRRANAFGCSAAGGDRILWQVIVIDIRQLLHRGLAHGIDARLNRRQVGPLQHSGGEQHRQVLSCTASGAGGVVTEHPTAAHPRPVPRWRPAGAIPYERAVITCRAVQIRHRTDDVQVVAVLTAVGDQFRPALRHQGAQHQIPTVLRVPRRQVDLFAGVRAAQ